MIPDTRFRGYDGLVWGANAVLRAETNRYKPLPNRNRKAARPAYAVRRVQPLTNGSNEMLKRILIYVAAPVIAILGILGLSGFKYQDHGWGHHRDPVKHAEFMVEHVTDYLNLNDVQKQKLVAVKDELMTARRELRQQRTASLDELVKQIESDKLDKVAVDEMIERKIQTVTLMTPGILDRIVEFHGSLTPEQRQKVVEKLQHWRQHAG